MRTLSVLIAAAFVAALPLACGGGGGATDAPAGGPVTWIDYDSDGDGRADLRRVGDFDGDGELTFDDIQGAVDGLCDPDGDGHQETEAIDRDGDGRRDRQPVCGVVELLPGTFEGGSLAPGDERAPTVVLRWSGLTLRGGGWAATRLRSNIDPDRLFTSRDAPRDNTPDWHILLNANNLEAPIHDLTISDLQILGVSSETRRALCAEGEGEEPARNCLVDPDADGVPDDVSHALAVSDCVNCVVERVWVRDADRIAFSVTRGGNLSEGGVIFRDNRTDGSIGEHCFVSVLGNLTVAGNDFSGCDHAAGNGKAVELWCGNNAFGEDQWKRVSVRDNRLHDIDHGIFLFGRCSAKRHEIQISDNQIWNFSAPAIWVQPQHTADEQQLISITDNLIAAPTSPVATPIRVRRLARAPLDALRSIRVAGNVIRFDESAMEPAETGMTGIQAEGHNVLVTGNVIDYVTRPGPGRFKRHTRCIETGAIKGASVASTHITISGNSCLCDNSRGACWGIRAGRTEGLTLSDNAVRFTHPVSQHTFGFRLTGAEGFLATGNRIQASGEEGAGFLLDGATRRGVIRGNLQQGMASQLRVEFEGRREVVFSDNTAYGLSGPQSTLTVGERTGNRCIGCR